MEALPTWLRHGARGIAENQPRVTAGSAFTKERCRRVTKIDDTTSTWTSDDGNQRRCAAHAWRFPVGSKSNMRVLYVTYHPDALSESYIRSEVEWMQRQGIEIAMLAHAPHEVTYRNTVRQVWLGTSLQEGLRRFRPDIVHVEWLFGVTWLHEQELSRDIGVPVTVRGHSFDFAPERALRVASLPAVERVFLFPHFARVVEHAKVRSLTSCFPDLFRPGKPDRPPFVLRAMAGVPHKNLETWLEIAALCPEVRFLLVLTRALPPDADYPERIRSQSSKNVHIRLNVPREGMVDIMRRASIYFTTGASHPVGMPVSIAEALASGQWILAPDVPGMREYIGAAGRTYRDSREAAELIREAWSFPEDRWTEIRTLAAEQAERFRADWVLGELLREWQGLVASKSRVG